MTQGLKRLETENTFGFGIAVPFLFTSNELLNSLGTSIFNNSSVAVTDTQPSLPLYYISFLMTTNCVKHRIFTKFHCVKILWKHTFRRVSGESPTTLSKLNTKKFGKNTNFM